MMRRRSKRFAIFAARASSSSLMPVEAISLEVRNGCSWSLIQWLLDEDYVQCHDDPDGAEPEQLRRAEPRLVARYRVVRLLLLALQSPHEPAQLRLGLRLRDQRDSHQHYRVGHEGDHRLPPGRGDLGAEVDRSLRMEVVREERRQEPGDHAE